MSAHEYSAQQAFELLMHKLRQKDVTLAAQVQTAVDMGKDIEETEPPSRGRKRSRFYRKTMPYSYEEALQVALNALSAYFVEQPLFIESCLDNMAKSPLGSPKGFRYARSAQKIAVGLLPGSQGIEKQAQIELRTETQLPVEQFSASIHETQWLTRAPAAQIEAQRSNVMRLRELFDFRDE
jgi:hypothetical protein